MRAYMEWTALPAGQGLAYVAPAAPLPYLHSLGTSLSFFLGGKGLLATGHCPGDTAGLLHAARANPEQVSPQLGLVAQLLRQKEQGLPLDEEARQYACAWLSSERAQAADVAALVIKLA